MDVNVATDMKGINVAVVPTNVEMEDAARPPVQPVPQNSESDTVKLNNQNRQGRPSNEAANGQGKLSQKDLEDAVEEIQERFQSMGSNFKFGLYRHSGSESIVAQLRDKKTGEVVKQFPPEEVLKLREKLQDLIGMLFDEKV